MKKNLQNVQYVPRKVVLYLAYLWCMFFESRLGSVWLAAWLTASLAGLGLAALIDPGELIGSLGDWVIGAGWLQAGWKGG